VLAVRRSCVFMCSMMVLSSWLSLFKSDRTSPSYFHRGLPVLFSVSSDGGPRQTAEV
jgi:hypothetical protein